MSLPLYSPADEMRTPVKVLSLGQSGFRLGFEHSTIYVDPYLTDSVADLEGEEMRRTVPPPLEAAAITDADLVFVTHAHLDHCDPATLIPISRSSPGAQFIVPKIVIPALVRAGIDPARMRAATEEWTTAGEVRFRAVAAVHPVVERDEDGAPVAVGYVIEASGRRIYHAGDTSLSAGLIEEVSALSPFDTAFLPVNERNYYRERRGIIANMSIREAFGFAADIRAVTLVPMHWDLFAPNSASEDEIRLLYDQLRPPFRLQIRPVELA